jgi:hypothetical protein
VAIRDRLRAWSTSSAFDTSAVDTGVVRGAAGAVAIGTVARRPGPLLGFGLGFGPPLAPFEVPPDLLPFWTREAAMSAPTVARSRNLLVSAIAALPFTFWRTSRVAGVDPVAIDAAAWAERPDPDRTRQWIVGQTVDDLLFYGLAHWRVTARGADTFPSAFRRVVPGELHVDHAGEVRIGTEVVDARDVIEFASPVDGILTNGYRAIAIALALDGAAERFADTEVPAGVLEEQDHSGEDLADDDLRRLADAFTAARHANVTAATNRYVRYREINYNAEAMQLVEGRTYQALELARLCNVPGYLVGAPAGTGMTYLNAQQAREDLITFGAAPLIGCLEETLSGPNVTARGQSVVMDQTAWLRNPFTAGEPGEPSQETPA